MVNTALKKSYPISEPNGYLVKDHEKVKALYQEAKRLLASKSSV